MALTVIPDVAITRTCASKRAVKCELGRLPGHVDGPGAVLGADGPGYPAVHDRPELPNVEAAPGALPRVAGAAARTAHRARHGGAGDPADSDVELLLAGPGRLEPHVLDSPLGPQPHRAPEEPRQHPRLGINAGTPLLHPSAEWCRPGSPRSRGEGRATHQKLRRARFCGNRRV